MALPLPRNRTLTRPPGPAAVRASFLAISAVVADRVSGWDEHRHAEHEAIIVGRGTYRCTLNGTALALAAGEALVVKPGDRHADHLAAGTAYHALWFSLAGGLFAPGVEAGQQVVRPGGGELVRTAERMHAQVVAGVPGPRLDAELAPLLWAFAAGLPPAALAGAFAPVSGFVTALHAEFARLPAGRIAVAALAVRLGLSPRTLERRCREALGCGPAQAHARWRLERAAELLLSTDWPVRAVSDTLGFANPFHFSRAFARAHRLPPAAWRSRGGNG